MAEEEDWIFDCVMNIFHSPEWETPVYDFIDENCIYFDNEEENKLQYTTIHEVKRILILDIHKFS